MYTLKSTISPIELEALKNVAEIVAVWSGQATSPDGWITLSTSERDGSLLAAAHIIDAERCPTLSNIISRNRLTRSVLVDQILVKGAGSDELNALLYLCAQKARIDNRTTLVIPVADKNSPIVSLGKFEHIKDIAPINNHYFFAEHVDRITSEIFINSDDTTRNFLHSRFVVELEAVFKRWLDKFFKSPWFNAIMTRSLSREQYIYTLSNQYQYVRFTTRHIAAAVAISCDRALRNHWRHHLEGEVDHERIIEKDLINLGVNVDYAINHMVPEKANFRFMLAQEAIVGFRCDPILFLAPPFVAEGFAANLGKDFIEALDGCAKKWGIDHPRHVTNFITSHIDFDGGDDGHWSTGLRMIGQLITTEKQHREFLAAVQLCMDAFYESYQAYSDDMIIFQSE